MQFLVRVSKEWTEPGEVTVEAESEEDAREIVKEMLVDGGDEIEWHGSNMDPGDTHVESVSKVS